MNMRHGQGKTVQQEADILDFLQRIPQENLGNSRLVLSKQDKLYKGFLDPSLLISLKICIPTVQIKLDFCVWCMCVCTSMQTTVMMM